MLFLYGKGLAKERRQILRQKLSLLPRSLGLAVILVGDNYASQVYVTNKQKAAKKVGIEAKLYELSSCISKEDLSNLIQKLNLDDSVDGILLQLPLPSHLDPLLHISEIDPLKDVDGFHPINVGKMALGLPCLMPCTPLGVINLLDHYQIEIKSKDIAVIGKSNIVGKPMAQMLLNRGATVTVCHSLTKDLKAHLSRSEIIISAAGHPNLITEDSLSKPAYLIDIGINRLSNGSICGDIKIDLDSENSNCLGITPVPGGVGPMTITTLLENTYLAYQLKSSL